MADIKRITGGGPEWVSALAKINECVDRINKFSKIQGDRRYINVSVEGGVTVSLNMAAVTGSIPLPPFPGGSAFFPVTVVQNGGANGTKTTVPTYTYNVYLYGTATAIDGGTPLPVSFARPIQFGQISATGTNGWATYASGTLVLAAVDEVWQVGSC